MTEFETFKKLSKKLMTQKHLTRTGTTNAPLQKGATTFLPSVEGGLIF